MYDAHVYFCLFYSEWGISTDDCLTMWHVGSGSSTPEVSRQSWCFWWGNWSPPCYKYHTEFVSCTVILLIFQDYTQSENCSSLAIIFQGSSKIFEDLYRNLIKTVSCLDLSMKVANWYVYSIKYTYRHF